MENSEYVQMLRAISAGISAMADFEESGRTESMMDWVEKYSSKLKEWEICSDDEAEYMFKMINETRKKMMN